MRFRAPNSSEALFYFDYKYLCRPLYWIVLNALHVLLLFIMPDIKGGYYFSGAIMSFLIVVCAIRINQGGVAEGGRIY